VNRKHDRYWTSASERSRVAAQLIEEAAALTDEVGSTAAATPPAPVEFAEPRELPSALPEPAAIAAPAPVLPVPLAVVDPAADEQAARPHLESALALSRKGLWAQAVPQLRRALEVYAAGTAIWCRLGEALNHTDDLAGAREAYERALALDAQHPRALYGLGVILDRLLRPAEATVMYRRAREAAPR
jgi:tetratricopeptide (TPR) repeat protein